MVVGTFGVRIVGTNYARVVVGWTWNRFGFDVLSIFVLVRRQIVGVGVAGVSDVRWNVLLSLEGRTSDRCGWLVWSWSLWLN